MRRVVILGAGGHGREVAEILRDQVQAGADFQIAGFVDENHNLHGQNVNELPVLGDWAWFRRVDCTNLAVICAVGQPCVSRCLVQKAQALDLAFVNAISPRAHVSPGAHIGQGVTVFPHVFVSIGVRLNDYCILNVGVSVSHDAQVGSYSNINPGVRLAGNVTIGEGCYVGMGTNVIQGRSIGSWSIIGAGAVVIADIPSHVTAVGVPARVIKRREMI